MKGYTEAKLNRWADYVLLAGSLLSVGLIVIGTVLFAVNSGGEIVHLIGMNVSDALSAAFRLQGEGIVNVGVYILLITPVLRVATGIIGFSLLGWWRFTAVSLVVLGVLTLSICVA